MKTNFASLLQSRKFILAIAAFAFAAVLPVFIRSNYIIGQVLTVMLIFAIYASSWNLLAYSGQGSLGHAAFLGIGGFASALLSIKLGVPPIIGILLGSVLSAGIGGLIGLACVRLKAWFLAMVTFGFSVIAVTIVKQFDPVLGGIVGFPTPLIVPQGIPFYYATLAIATVSIAAILLVMRSKLGLAFKAIHENELEAKMIGINAGKYRLLAFVISTFFAGLAGGLYAESILFIENSIFDAYYSFQPLMMCVIGGLGTIEGPIIGSVLIVAIESYLPRIDPFLQFSLGSLFSGVSNVGPPLRLIGLGLFLLIVVIFAPKGVTSLIRKIYDYLRVKLGE